MNVLQLSCITVCAFSAAVFVSDNAQAQNASPPRRAHHALVYDESNQRVLLAGGSTPLDGGLRFEFYSDLWAFDGVRWHRLSSTGDARSGQRIAYDEKRQAIFSFGGYAGGQSLSDLRRLDDTTWVRVAELAERPTAEGGFIFDVARGRYVLFGGSGGRRQTYADTWEFDGNRWQKVGVAGPEARQAFAMVYDPKRRKTVVFGGMAAAGTMLGDTWEFDGRRWQRVATNGPSARASAGYAFDARRGVLILFGGAGADGLLGDTWAWDGKTWTKLADDGPEPRAMGELAYDRERDRLVLFGGRKGWPNGDLNDTWEWDGTQWQRK